MKKVPINAIQIGDRRREDMGNIDVLAESIRRFGLLHPVVVDEQNRLVAGGRRLEACKSLGWEEVPVTLLGELSERQLREIELEENIRRKDLTEYELSKNMVELAEIKAQQLKEAEAQTATDRFLAEPAKNPSGRPRKVDSHEAVASALGVPRRTLQDAYAHVEAVKQYPELAVLPKTHAIEIARQLKSAPAPVREEKRQQLQAIQEAGQHKEDLIEEVYRIQKTFRQAVYGAATLLVDEHHLNAWLREMPQTELQRQWELVEEASYKLSVLRDHLKKVFGGPRLVKLGGASR